MPNYLLKQTTEQEKKKNIFIKQRKNKWNGENIQSKVSRKGWDGHCWGKQQSTKIVDTRGDNRAQQVRREMGGRSVGQEWRKRGMIS